MNPAADLALALKSATAGLLVFWVFVIWARFRATGKTLSALAVLITTLCYLFVYLVPTDGVLFWPIFILNLFTPLALLGAAQTFFNPEESMKTLMILSALQSGLCVWARVAGLPLPNQLALTIMATNALTVVMIVRNLWQQSREDLVSVRRDLRMIVTIMLGSYVVGVSIFTSLADKDASYRMPLRAIEAMVLMIMVFALNASLVRREFWEVIWGFDPRGHEVDREQTKMRRQLELQTLRDQQVKAITDLFEQEKIYLSQKLSVADVASKLGLPEHQLRQLINQHLGFENFNHFVNRYRIDHATRLLKDPARANDKVFALALESGFSSLAPFNRAFMDTHKTTPSAYRNQNTLKSDQR